MTEGEMSSIPSWFPWAALVVGVALVTLGVLFRAGRMRGGASYYWDDALPFYARNVGFSLVPFGAMFLCWSAAGVLLRASNRVGYALIAAGVAFAGLAFVLLIAPPAWVKPRWLRSVEATRYGSTTPTRVFRAAQRRGRSEWRER